MANREENGHGAFLPVANHTTSFWRSAPHALDNFRSSDTVPQTCDIAIIGCGLAGVMTAYHILKQTQSKANVVIFEAREACSGATGRNGGHSKVLPTSLRAMEIYHGTEAAAQLVAVQLAQSRALKKIVEDEDLDCDLFLTRSFDIFFDEEEAAEIKAWLKQHHDSGDELVQAIQWLEGPNLERMTGVRGLKWATSSPAFSLWPYKFVTGLLAKCIELGAKLFTHTPVTSTKSASSGTVLSTPRGDCLAGKVVYATNGYSTSLLPAYQQTITPIRGSACRIIHQPEDQESAPPFLRFTFNLHYNSSQVDYLVPRPDGSIILGGGAWTFRHDKSQWHNTVDDAHLIESVRSHFESVMPKHFIGWDRPGVKIDKLWTGIMGYTTDALPHVGRVPDSQDEYILAGYNGGGMVMICVIAEAIARMVVEGVAFEETGLPTCYKTTKKRVGSREDVRETK